MTIDTDRFNAALHLFSSYSRKAGEEVLKAQARGLVKTVIEVTPPGGKNVASSKAKARGQASTTGDILKLFVGAPGQTRPINMRAIHEAHRSKPKGRVKNSLVPRVVVAQADLARYITEQRAKVGFLASGWNESAARFGFKPPAWVWRNSGEGSIRIELTDNRLTIRMVNSVRYASAISDIRALIQWAVHAQTAKLIRQMQFSMPAIARKAGFI